MEETGLIIATLMRAGERWLVVLFAGLSIYYGYRLFLSLPMRDHEGRIELPGFKVVLAKGGPGIFFVAFGTAVLLTAFTEEVNVDLPRGTYAGFTARPVISSGALPLRQDASSRLAERSRVELTLQILNCLPVYAAAAGGSIDPAIMEPALRDARLALLRPVWDEAAWGDFETFVRWASTGEGDVPEAVRRLYLDHGRC